MLAGIGPHIKEQLDLTETAQSVVARMLSSCPPTFLGDSIRTDLAVGHVWPQPDSENKE